MSWSGKNPLIGAQGDTKSEKYYVKWVKTVGMTTAGHISELQNTAGETIYKAVADGANFSDFTPIFAWVEGLNISDLDSGSMMIYVR